MTSPRTQDPSKRLADITRPEKPFNSVRWIVTSVLLVSLLITTGTIDVELARLWDLPGELWIRLQLMFFPPDISQFGRALSAMWESVAIAWIGTVIGAILSFPLAFFAAENLSRRAPVTIVRQILNVFRAVPEIIFAIVFLPIFGLGPLTGTFAIGISSIGTLGKLTSEVIEGIDRGPVEAADATGANKAQRVRWGVVPQIMPEVVALWLYRFEINVRAAAVLGAVGAGGVGTLAQRQLLLVRDWAGAGMTLLVVVGVTLLIDAISGRLRRRIIRGPMRPVDTGTAADEGATATS